MLVEGFHFYTQHNLVELTGLKAKNPVELLENIKKVPATSIYYHTHRFIQQHHYIIPEPPNDFALWLKNTLHLEHLGEEFLDVDTVSFVDLEALRKVFIRILESHISRGLNQVASPKGHEFYFMSCQIFVIPTPYTASNLKEFVDVLSKISIHSLYFHVFEARLRLKKEENDFSAWFKGIGEDDLAREIAKLGPYNLTLNGLRIKIIDMVKQYAEP